MMPACARLIYPDTALHIVQRGHNRNSCFRGDGDYLVYLSHLRHLLRRHVCQLHAYCLMTNHVHLLVTPASAEACGGMMRDLGRSYVRYFNERQNRRGTLWESRYWSCLAQSSRYVMACYRYIELNPVRAGMVPDATGYAWSSHRANAGLGVDESITQHADYASLANDQVGRAAAYRQLFDLPLEDEVLRSIREATYAGYPLASDEFKSMLSDRGWRTKPGKPGPKIITTLSRN
jgi:putative transposase